MLRTFEEVNHELGKYKGEEGLKRAILDMKLFHKENDRLPTSEDKEMRGGIKSAIKKREWTDYGIISWNDLMLYVFGEINKEWGVYRGKEGLKSALKRLKEFRKEYGRLPKAADKKMRAMQGAANRGEWKEDGVNSWNDLLKKAFNEINTAQNIYCGQKGFERAKKELLEFKKKYNRLPTSKVAKGIVGAIYRGEWKEQAITSWNDLLNMAFGKINSKFGVYTGKDGLERAMKELRAFKSKNNRLPKNNDKGVRGIVNAINRGKWNAQGISTWNDLLQKTFGKINVQYGKYKGISGLELAIKELKDFKEKNNKLPSSKDKEFGSIVGAIYRGEWKEQAITSWNILMKKTFNRVNSRQYSGKDGLEEAMKKLRELKNEKKRLPTNRDKGMLAINAVIYQGTWKKEGINTWNDLVERTFGTVNVRANRFMGEQGFKNAMDELLKFKERYSRSPTTKDKGMSSILNAIYTGRWISFRINNWNDLLRRAKIEDHLERISDPEVRKLAKNFIEEIKSWKAADIKSIKRSVSMKVHGKLFVYFEPRREFFRIYGYTEEGEWKSLANVKSTKDLEEAIRVTKEAYKRKEGEFPEEK